MYKYLFNIFLLFYFLICFASSVFAQIKDYGTLVIKLNNPAIEVTSPKNHSRIDQNTVVMCLKEGRNNISWREEGKVENKSVVVKTGLVATVEIGNADAELIIIADRAGISVELIGYSPQISKYAGEKLTFNNLKFGPATLIAKLAGKKDLVKLINISKTNSPVNIGWDDATLDVRFDRANVDLYINNQLEATSNSAGQIISLSNISPGLKKISGVATDQQGNKYLLEVDPKELQIEANKTYAVNLTRKDALLQVSVDRPAVEITVNGVTLVSEKAQSELVFPSMLPGKTNLKIKSGSQIINKEVVLLADQVVKESISWNDATLIIQVDRPNVDILINKKLLATSQISNERIILKNLAPQHILIEAIFQALGNNFYPLEANPKEFDLLAGQTVEVMLSKRDAQLIVTTDRRDEVDLLLNNQITPLNRVDSNVYHFPFISPGKVFLSAKLKEKPLLGTDILLKQIDLPVGQTPIKLDWEDIFLFVEVESKIVNLKVNGQEGTEIFWDYPNKKTKKVYVFSLKPHQSAEISWELLGKKAKPLTLFIKELNNSQGLVITNRQVPENK
ncbi:MAG: hypothetical protein WAQ98_06925 [Blastocatellia bacterium]